MSGNIASCQGNCKIQSAANRVPNGGFDRDLGGWASTPGDPDGAQWWAGDDVSGCQTSGVMRTKSSAFSPCFSVPPSTALDFGAALNAPDPISAGTGQARCTVTFYDDASCMGNNVGFASVKVSTAGWQRQSTAVATSADTMSAKVECRCFAELAFFDEIYLSPPPTAF